MITCLHSKHNADLAVFALGVAHAGQTPIAALNSSTVVTGRRQTNCRQTYAVGRPSIAPRPSSSGAQAGSPPPRATAKTAPGEVDIQAARSRSVIAPAVEAAAQDGDPTRFALPRPLIGRPNADFSLSGLKTAVARWVEARGEAGLDVPVADVAASFQEAVADVLTRKAVDACRAHGVDHLIIGGGVAANSRLRALAAERCEAAGIRLRVPRPGLCTDNGAMVAALGAELMARGAQSSPLDFPADSSLPVTTVLC